MSVFSGSQTYTRFFTDPAPKTDGFLAAIRLRRFRDLVPSDEDRSRIGWVDIRHPLETDLGAANVFEGEHLLLGFRVDAWKVTADLLKARLKSAEAARLEATGQTRLSKTQRDDVRVMVVRHLREQMIPMMTVVGVDWNLNTGVIRFHSSKKPDAFVELFEATFKGLSLVQAGALSIVERRSSRDDAMELAGLEPTPFHYQPAGAA